VALLWLLGAAGVAACGGQRATPAHPAGAPFAWLRERPPRGWRTIAIVTGAKLIYPPSWRPAHGDPGTATVVLKSRAGTYLGYLNLTPREDDERLSTWPAFRLAHNREEGDRHVLRLAAADGLRFHAGTGSCVEDTYTTRAATRFREIACLVSGARATSVIVGAAPPSQWRRMAPTLQRAIANVST
jgi:hypothetical protein